MSSATFPVTVCPALIPVGGKRPAEKETLMLSGWCCFRDSFVMVAKLEKIPALLQKSKCDRMLTPAEEEN